MLCLVLTALGCQGRRPAADGATVRYALVRVGATPLPARSACADVPFAGSLELEARGRWRSAEQVRTGCAPSGTGRVEAVGDSGQYAARGDTLTFRGTADPRAPGEPTALGLRRGDTLFVLGYGHDGGEYV